MAAHGGPYYEILLNLLFLRRIGGYKDAKGDPWAAVWTGGLWLGMLVRVCRIGDEIWLFSERVLLGALEGLGYWIRLSCVMGVWYGKKRCLLLHRDASGWQSIQLTMCQISE